MPNTVLKDKDTGQPIWIDFLNPTLEELTQLKRDYGLHFTSIQDCIEPGHLPKYEKVNEVTFIIIRAYDESSNHDDDNIRKMTRKVSLFLGDRFLITVHRQEIPFLEELKKKYQCYESEIFLQVILLEIIMDAVETYHTLLEEAEMKIEDFEMAVLGSEQAKWEDIFRAKRRLSVTKRMLWHSLNTAQKFVPQSAANMPICQDLRERIENLQFFTDGLLEDLNNIQSIQLSLSSNSLSQSSHKTNEVMRLLTVFSIFFLPINFIVGAYGMNFEYLPGVKTEYGYLVILGVILLIELCIFTWVRKKGWLSQQKVENPQI